MSKYEMLDYDDMLARIGIPEPTNWHCGSNPEPNLTYEEAGVVYDDVYGYNGRSPHAAGNLCLTDDINVNGLLLNHRDANGTIWLCTDIEGWWTLPPQETPDIQRPYWDGSMLTTGRFQARQITISGCFIPPDPSLVWYNRDALIRVSSIVRGIGLLAVCGNQTPGMDIYAPNNAYDPPKMAMIQMADVPLIETTKPNGFTQFSLSFRCINPTKMSLYEHNAAMAYESGAVTRLRNYKAFSQTVAEGDTLTTAYDELWEIEGLAGKQRRYSDVKKVNYDSLIPDEEMTETGAHDPEAYEQNSATQTNVLYNSGNYFSFPIFVFDQLDGTSTTKKLTVQNLTTGEKMQIQKPVPAGQQLVVDSGLRRVGQITPFGDASGWIWDDRSHLTLGSQWLSLAPGENTIIVSTPDASVNLTKLPQIYWRDTWIG
jgi:hypothetical protein